MKRNGRPEAGLLARAAEPALTPTSARHSRGAGPGPQSVVRRSKRRRFTRAAAVFGASATLLAGCADATSGDSGTTGEGGTTGAQSAVEGEANVALPTVTVGSYPLAFIALAVGGDEINLVDLSSGGGHAHDMELSPAQVGQLSQSDLTIYLSQGFQPAVETAITQAGVDSLDVFEVLPEDSAIPQDPHVWLDPQNVATIGYALATAFDAKNPGNDGYYQRNAKTLAEQMDEVDAAYDDALQSCAGQTLLTSHEAFGYLAARFDLDQVGVLGVDPDAEPSPARLRQVQSLIAERGITTLFAEPGAGHTHDEGEAEDDDDGAEAGALGVKLAATLGLDLEVLDPAEVQVDPDRDLIGVYWANLGALQHGLPCAVAS